MSKKYYNKLVRDKIPEIIKQSGLNCVTKRIDSTELKFALKRKLLEEANEFVNSDMSKEEMADIFEVINTILHFNNWSYEQIKQIQINKEKERGGFKNSTYLVYVEEKEVVD